MHDSAVAPTGKALPINGKLTNAWMDMAEPLTAH